MAAKAKRQRTKPVAQQAVSDATGHAEHDDIQRILHPERFPRGADRPAERFPSTYDKVSAPAPAKPKTLLPFADRIVVKRDTQEEMTRGGIILPEVSKDKPQSGTVIAVGPGRFENGVLVPMSINVGQKVLFGKYSGTDVTVNDQALVVMLEHEIMGQFVDAEEPIA